MRYIKWTDHEEERKRIILFGRGLLPYRYNTCLSIQYGLSEAVNLRRTDNTMAKLKSTITQTNDVHITTQKTKH